MTANDSSGLKMHTEKYDRDCGRTGTGRRWCTSCNNGIYRDFVNLMKTYAPSDR